LTRLDILQNSLSFFGEAAVETGTLWRKGDVLKSGLFSTHINTQKKLKMKVWIFAVVAIVPIFAKPHQ